MSPNSAFHSFQLAQKHLKRVQASWDPPQWLDLSAYGLYAIEAAVVAAALDVGITLKPAHWAKAAAAEELARHHGLPDVADLMKTLNDIRKSEAYGDVTVPHSLDPEDVAREIEEYVDAVGDLLDKDDESDEEE